MKRIAGDSLDTLWQQETPRGGSGDKYIYNARMTHDLYNFRKTRVIFKKIENSHQ